MLKKIVFGAVLVLSSSTVTADVFMDEAWAAKLCDAWNGNSALTDDLAKDDWMKNNARGYKLIQMYREECGESSLVQLKIEERGSQAICATGGLPDGQKLSKKVDYRLSAKDKHWQEMQAGTYGPLKAMMFGYMTLQGPYDEAMYNMKPFTEFLRVAGAIPGDMGPNNCPKASKSN